MSGHAALTVPARGWRGTLNGVQASTSAWAEEDWATLGRLAGRRRRTNVVMDGADGERAYAGDIAPPDPFDMYWFVTGYVDRDGNPNDDPEAGLEETLDYLAANWFVDADEDRGTIEAVVTSPLGRTLVVQLQVDEFEPLDGREECRLRLRVQVPAGTQLGSGVESA